MNLALRDMLFNIFLTYNPQCLRIKNYGNQNPDIKFHNSKNNNADYNIKTWRTHLLKHIIVEVIVNSIENTKKLCKVS